jgi:hypothetical protein
MKDLDATQRFEAVLNAGIQSSRSLAMKTSALFLFAPLLAAAEPALKWHQEGNRSLELRGADGPVVRFVLDCAPQDPHFEVLATADGRNLVWVGPGDHVWHYGLWFSWKLINDVNFWETDPATGKQAGRSEILEPKIESTPDGATATIRYRDRAHPLADGPAVLEDEVVIRITRPQNGLGPQVVWQLKTTALAAVELGRTPLPDEPNGKPYGGYGGFSWRGAKDLKDTVFTDSEGRQGMAMHRQHASWVDATGSLAGKPAGITVCNHPSNPGHPSSWFLATDTTPQGPFWFVNPALLQPKPIKMKQGESFLHRYQATVHGGRAVSACAQEASTFGSAPPLP